MAATITGYYPPRPIVPYPVVRKSAPKKGFTFLKNLKTEEEQIKFFKESLRKSVDLPYEKVPKGLMDIRRVKDNDVLFKIDRENEIIFGVERDVKKWTETVITVYNYHHHKKGFALREVAKIKGSLVDIVV